MSALPQITWEVPSVILTPAHKSSQSPSAYTRATLPVQKAWRRRTDAAVPSQQVLQRTCRALSAAAARQAEVLVSVEEAKGGLEFNVATAIALAGCAFESYNEPTRVTSKLQERSNNGTVTTYIDRDFLANTVAGTLSILVRGAKNLPACDLWGTSDPYCIVSIGDSIAKTTHKERTLNPIWDEDLRLYVRKSRAERLLIRVLDKDTLSADEDLGSILLAVEDLTDGKQHELDIQLEGPQQPPSIQLRVQYLPLSEAMGDLEEAEMGGPAQGSALEGLTSSAWREIAEISGRTADELYNPLCFIENDVTDTQMWLLWNAAVKSLVIAFRGTEQVKWKDMMTDLSFQPAPFNPERVLERSSSASLIRQEDEEEWDWGQLAPRVFQAFSGAGNGLSASEKAGVERAANAKPWVHMGFLKAYDSVRAKIMAVSDEVMGGEPRSWQAYVTGHSLGGALATLCSYELANRRYRGRKGPGITMYNYGSPRVGNAAFARAYDESVPNSWRITNKLDVIPRVPRLMGYSHVGNSCSVLPDGTFEVNDKKIDVFEEGHGPEDVLPLLAQKAIRAAKTKGEENTAEIQALLQHEMDFMQTLITGSALTEHMEEFYLDTLRALATAEASISGIANELEERKAGEC